MMAKDDANPTSQKIRMSGERARRVFLKAIEAGHTTASAAALTGYTSQALYKWKWADAEFKADWLAASGGYVTSLETEALTVAMSKSPAAPAMLCFLLAAAYPERYCGKVRARHWQADAAKRAADEAGSATPEVVEALFAHLDALEAAKIARGNALAQAALDPMLA